MTVLENTVSASPLLRLSNRDGTSLICQHDLHKAFTLYLVAKAMIALLVCREMAVSLDIPKWLSDINVVEILKAVKDNELGIVALALLVIAALSLFFFKDAPLKPRLYVFFAVFTAAIVCFAIPASSEYARERKAADDLRLKSLDPVKAGPDRKSGDSKTSGNQSPANTGDGNAFTYNPSPSPQPPRARGRH